MLIVTGYKKAVLETESNGSIGGVV